MSRLVEFSGDSVEISPKFLGYLKVVSLVDAYVKKGFVTSEGKIILRVDGTQGFRRLAMDISPKIEMFRRLNNPTGIALGKFLSFYIQDFNEPPQKDDLSQKTLHRVTM